MLGEVCVRSRGLSGDTSFQLAAEWPPQRLSGAEIAAHTRGHGLCGTSSGHQWVLWLPWTRAMCPPAKLWAGVTCVGWDEAGGPWRAELGPAAFPPVTGLGFWWFLPVSAVPPVFHQAETIQDRSWEGGSPGALGELVWVIRELTVLGAALGRLLCPSLRGYLLPKVCAFGSSHPFSGLRLTAQHRVHQANK